MENDWTRGTPRGSTRQEQEHLNHWMNTVIQPAQSKSAKETHRHRLDVVLLLDARHWSNNATNVRSANLTNKIYIEGQAWHANRQYRALHDCPHKFQVSIKRKRIDLFQWQQRPRHSVLHALLHAEHLHICTTADITSWLTHHKDQGLSNGTPQTACAVSPNQLKFVPVWQNIDENARIATQTLSLSGIVHLSTGSSEHKRTANITS